jgi:tyrosyl-tRNA synthetase
LPEDAPQFTWPLDGDVDLVDLLAAAGLVPSKSEAKRLIAQGGVSVDGRRVEAERAAIAPGSIVRAGRRRFIRVVDGTR